jgi:polyisoprenoid-binding protein YceI
MRRTFLGSLAVFALAVGSTASTRAADTYTVDNVHTSVYFKIRHLGISSVYGRFNKVAGKFTVDKENPGKSSFALTITIDSVDTGNKMRDGHLKSGDFFNAKQFPLLKFKSTKVKAVKGGYRVTGNLTLHGVTKSISFTLQGGKQAEFPPKVKRIGFTTELTLKRSDFGMKKMLNALGDKVTVGIGMEGVKARGE